ncbi:unnamed protein product, partial [Discosporangium mesarthrocarpum]
SPPNTSSSVRCLFRLVKALVALNAKGLGFPELMAALQGMVEKQGGSIPKQSIGNIAKCMAVLCAHTGEGARGATVARLVDDMKGANETKKHLALLVVGELGRQADLSRGIILGTFEAGDEEVKTAAAYSLGHMAVGNMSKYLPVILDTLERSKHQYLLLSSLKEVIVCHAETEGLEFSIYVDQVLPHLFWHCESEEEGVRNMVAECLGVLATMHPSKIVPALVAL